MRVVVLGIGNILLTDEGVGVRVVERLGEQYKLPEGVELIDGGTCGMEMLEQLEELDALIDRMLLKDPAKRFKSLVAVQVELSKIQRKYCPA